MPLDLSFDLVDTYARLDLPYFQPNALYFVIVNGNNCLPVAQELGHWSTSHLARSGAKLIVTSVKGPLGAEITTI
jgi:hypothetical protein